MKISLCIYVVIYDDSYAWTIKFVRTINSKINVTPNIVNLPILAAANLLADNSLYLCRYVQLNSLRLKSNVASKWVSKHLRGYHLFCC